MADIEALVFDEIKSAQISDNGQYAVFTLANGSGTINLALPSSQLMHLLTLSSQLAGEAARRTNADPNLKHALPCEWWNFDLAHDNKTMILSFRLPGGMELSFQVHRDRAPQMIEALNAILGQHTSPPPGTMRQ